MMRTLRNLFILLLSIAIAGCSFNLRGDKHVAGARGAHLPPTDIKNIVLLLPLSGETAQEARAVQSGFFAAYYQARESNPYAPQVTVLNSNRDNIQSVYEQAVSRNADIIVGPLLKENVTAIENMGNLPVPVLALNANEDTTVRVNNSVYNFSLSPQQETEQAARRMWSEGYRHPLVITLDSEWGNGIGRTFTSTWQSFGGQITDSIAIKPQAQNLNAIVKDFLQFEGNVRGEAIDEITGKAPQQRRDDFDVIFLGLPAPLAKQVYPQFRFYHADQVPAYAISLIYSGKPNAQADRDLNGIYFIDMPSIIHRDNTLLDGQSNPRLFAFGYDAYLITEKLHSLTRGGRIQGLTGELLLNNYLDIYRELDWARFQNGVPVAIR